MIKTFFHTLISLYLCLIYSAVTLAGTLDELEESATKERSQNPSSSTSPTSTQSEADYQDDDESLSEGIMGEIVGAVFEVMIRTTGQAIAYGGESSLNRYQRTQPEENEPLFRIHGDPLLPTVKVGSSWLYGTGGITAQTNRLEAGYGMVGVSYIQNRLFESDDSLSLQYALLHYRMSFGNNFTWDFAVGEGRLKGNDDYKGSVVSTPIRLRVNPKLHLEYFPIWSSFNGGSLAEHHISLNYQLQYVGLNLGYQKWAAEETSVNGIVAGIFASF